jgi:DNA-directed RNA polymerase subunit RPC12/RpoP
VIWSKPRSWFTDNRTPEEKEEANRKAIEKAIDKAVAQSGLRKGIPTLPTHEDFIAFISTSQGMADYEEAALYDPECKRNLEGGKRYLAWRDRCDAEQAEMKKTPHGAATLMVSYYAVRGFPEGFVGFAPPNSMSMELCPIVEGLACAQCGSKVRQVVLAQAEYYCPNCVSDVRTVAVAAQDSQHLAPTGRHG